MSTTTSNRIDTSGIATARWRIAPARSRVEFQVPHLYGLASVKGRFERYDGTLPLTDSPAVELTIEAGSLDTGNGTRDKHLRSADFFDVAHHPEIRFVSERAELEGERLKVVGRLYAAGKSIALELEGTLRRKDDELDVGVSTQVDHRRLGMTWNRLGMVGSSSTLIVRGRLVGDAE